jgi:hypothetical protein
MAGVPYTFATASTTLPLQQLDTNFQTPITIGNASVALGNAITTIGNLTLTNVTISSGNVTVNVVSSNVAITGGNISGANITNISGNVTGAIPNSSITNAMLANSNVTIGNTSVSLGGTTANLGNITLANVTLLNASGNVAGGIPAGSITNAQLQNNSVTIGNAAVALGNAITTIGNLTLTNVTISSLSTPVTVTQGGTGLGTLSSNAVLVGNGTGTVTSVAPGTNGNYLTSNGTAWISATPGSTTGNVTYGNTTVALGGTSASIGNLTLNNPTLNNVATLSVGTLNAPSGVLATQNGMTGIAKAWVNFSSPSTVVTLNSSFNVSSVTRNGTGDYTLNFTTAMTDANYAVGITVNGSASGGQQVIGAVLSASIPSAPTLKSTTQLRVSASTTSPTLAYFDVANYSVLIFGT